MAYLILRMAVINLNIKSRSKLLTFALVLLTALLFDPRLVNAHPGNTDASGGHYCRTNCSSWGLGHGEYHFHGGSYSEPDYYDQGYDFGTGEAIENNREMVVMRAQRAGEDDGKLAGERAEHGAAADVSYLEIPDLLCELEFTFQANAHQDYIDGVYDGWNDTCPEISTTAYSDAYKVAYERGYETYLKAANEQNVISDKAMKSNAPHSSSGADNLGWLWGIGSLVTIYGGAALVNYWDKIKNLFK